MEKKIMIFSDSLKLYADALRYSVALARRLNSELTLLLILSAPSNEGMNSTGVVESISMLDGSARALFKEFCDSSKDAGLAMETAVRVGNPQSELVKYLAEASFQILVWGGEANPMTDRTHWLAQVKGRVKCPIVIPRRKRKDQEVEKI
jgi:hypothetical protein